MRYKATLLFEKRQSLSELSTEYPGFCSKAGDWDGM